MFPITPTKQLRRNTNNFIVSSWSFLRLFIETVGTTAPIPVYAIVYRHSIIHPSGVFDRLYPNEHSPIHPPRATHV